jgi:hypothetical protein
MLTILENAQSLAETQVCKFFDGNMPTTVLPLSQKQTEGDILLLMFRICMSTQHGFICRTIFFRYLCSTVL